MALCSLEDDVCLYFYWKYHLLRAEFLSGSCGKTSLEVLPRPDWLRFIFPEVSVCFSSCHSEERDATYSMHPDFSPSFQCRMNLLLGLAVQNVGSAPPPLTSGPSSMQTQGVHSFLHGLYFYFKKLPCFTDKCFNFMKFKANLLEISFSLLFFCFLGALAHTSHQEEWWWRDTDGDEMSLLPFLDTRHAWHCACQVGSCYLTREPTTGFSHLENSSEIFLWKFS